MMRPVVEALTSGCRDSTKQTRPPLMVIVVLMMAPPTYAQTTVPVSLSRANKASLQTLAVPAPLASSYHAALPQYSL